MLNTQNNILQHRDSYKKLLSGWPGGQVWNAPMSAMNIHKTLRRIEVENSNIILYKTLGKSIRIDTDIS